MRSSHHFDLFTLLILCWADLVLGRSFTSATLSPVELAGEIDFQVVFLFFYDLSFFPPVSLKRHPHQTANTRLPAPRQFLLATFHAAIFRDQCSILADTFP
ncbi:hypothetical protein RRSWK_04744 [Rhodopirellula sp. SWK7]|nr:hypothetical protein RRSWK_04744 [Rhodopirellula sp. SWK7]